MPAQPCTPTLPWSNFGSREAVINAATDPPVPNFLTPVESYRPDDSTPQTESGAWAGN